MNALSVGAVAALGVWCLFAPAPERRAPPAVVTDPEDGDLVRRGRHLWPVLAGLGSWAFVGGWPGLAAGALAAVVVRHLVARAEPRQARRDRDAVRRDLPVVVLLLGTALRGGAATLPAVRQVCAALPGPAADRLAAACDRIALGVDPERVWQELAEEPSLAPLGRTLARSHRSGAPVARAVTRLAEDLSSTARAEVEDRARAVGVRAAVPLGVCLLPSFLLLGVVPLVVALLSGLQL